MRPRILGLSLVIAVVAAAAGCGPSKRNTGDDEADDDGIGSCTEGERQCDGNVLSTCTGGEFVETRTCDVTCDESLGCVVCEPLTGTCSGNTSTYCLADGSGYADEVCDPLLGVTCNGETGLCDGACAPHLIGDSYIGCEYYPTVTGNAVGNNFHFAVAISNTTSGVADVTIDSGGLTTAVSLQVQPGSVATQVLPWIHELKLCTGPTSSDCLSPAVQGANLVDGSYHLRSTQPVTVYQFNPLEYRIGSEYSYSNDASLLLPTNAWSGNYIAATWPKFDANAPDTWPSLVAVTAAQDNTQITITTTAATNAATGLPAFAPGVPQTITLDAGDVIELASYGSYGDGIAGDLTGTIVAADQPVQMMAAHYCTYIPDLSTGACDHMEESMFPIEALSTRYIVTAPAVTGVASGKRQIVKIVATEPNTTLSYDPPQSAATTIAAAGQFVQTTLAASDFVIEADHKVLVMQYMEGQDFTSNTGDPGMALAVPVDQYRLEYLFHAPTNYESNFVNVTAPTGAVVTLDDSTIPVSSFTAIGASGYGIARVQLGTGVEGNHTLRSDLPVGISVMGYGQWTSYWYPGGLDLKPIVIE